MKILADASLPDLEDSFPAPFVLSHYANLDELSFHLPKQDILLCRSTLKIDRNLLQSHQLRYVATASSGTDHLEHSFLNTEKIAIVDAKGCNAEAVADYVIACVAWLKQQKLIQGNKAGIIGLGNVGTKVGARLRSAQFQIVPYDPLKASKENTFQSASLDDLYDSDLLCIHAELHNCLPYSTVNLIDSAFLSRLKPSCVIINAARGGIVNEEALLNLSSALIYCTDVYHNEPNINKDIIDRATLCTPHIAGHSVEAKKAAVSLLSKKLHQLLGFPVPEFTLPEKPKNCLSSNSGAWPECLLSLYNPFAETQQLKQAQDKKAAFLTLRKNHTSRHDFSVYVEDNNFRTTS